MKTYARSLWNFNTTMLNLLELTNPWLKRHFPGHPFPSTTFNFGPRVCTIPHKDLKNVSWGWCSVTSLGDYDPTKGGHLVLWDLNLVIEFPPYSTIFLPSAIIMHSNTKIGEEETRLTITQYMSGGLLSWLAHGHGPKGDKMESEMEWWNTPRHRFSTVQDVLRQSNAKS
jgi:hypothetical protein